MTQSIRPIDWYGPSLPAEAPGSPPPAGACPIRARRSVDREGMLDDDPSYRRILGESAWWRLPAGTRRRFSHKPRRGVTLRYHGVMSLVHRSRAGAVLAHLLRTIGTPLPPYRGRQVPVVIELARDASGGILWSREYAFDGERPLHIQSVKLPHGHDRLLEVVGAGVSMVLEVFEHGRLLHFRSIAYFCRVGPFRLPIPTWLTPGRTHVLHRDEGQGRFRFIMRIRHPVLGLTFYQEGLFSEAEVS